MKHERDRERLRKLHEKLRQEKIQQMIGLDKIADISTSQLDGGPEMRRNQHDLVMLKKNGRQQPINRSPSKHSGSPQKYPMILQSADELFKNRKLTFEDLHKLNYKHFNNGKEKQEDQFRPSDIIDLNDKDDNDVLRKF